MKAQRLRVTFARGDVLRYITHLDLMRAWERAIKRAGLPIAYSEGFTRPPHIAIGAPLPVGATGEAELMDVYLEEPVAPAEFQQRLAAQTPPGLKLRAVEDVPLARPSLQSIIREWRWRALLPPDSDPDDAEARVARFLALETFPWELRRDKDTRQYDLRATVLGLTVERGPDGPALLARLTADAGGRPEQLAMALGYDRGALRIHRLGLVLDEPGPTGARGPA